MGSGVVLVDMEVLVLVGLADEAFSERGFFAFAFGGLVDGAGGVVSTSIAGSGIGIPTSCFHFNSRSCLFTPLGLVFARIAAFLLP